MLIFPHTSPDNQMNFHQQQHSRHDQSKSPQKKKKSLAAQSIHFFMNKIQY